MLAAPRHPVPIFPLPGVVLFPHAEMPLHIFELRYRTMVRDALSAGRILALALLMPGWERDYHGSPEYHPLGCLARFEEVEWLPNDCYNLRVVGLSRVRFERVTKEYPYRAATVTMMPDDPYTEDDPLIRIERRNLIDTLERIADAAAIESGAPRARFAADGATFAQLVNSLCTLLDLPPEEKLRLLEFDSVVDRGHRVLELAEARLRQQAAPPRPEGGGEHN